MFKDNCWEDRLNGPTTDLDLIEYKIGSGSSDLIELGFTQKTDGCPLSASLEFFISELGEWQEYATQGFVKTWNSKIGGLTLYTTDNARYSGITE